MRPRSAAILAIGVTVVVGITIFGRTHLHDLKATALPRMAPVPAPQFDATTLDGRKISLQTFAGRPLVVNFFATWCDPCKVETPGLARVERRLAGRVSFLSVALTSTLSGIHSFVGRYHITWPVVDDHGSLISEFKLWAQPTTFVITGRGQIVFKHTGITNSRMLTRALQPLLATTA